MNRQDAKNAEQLRIKNYELRITKAEFRNVKKKERMMFVGQ